jgi:archaellum component FlaC
VIDENVLKEYFDDNRRIYPNNYWGKIYEKAKKSVSKDLPALQGKEKMDKILKTTRNNCFSLMNFRAYYKFIETELKDEDKVVAEVRQDERMKSYNKKWHGYYTKEDIDYLEKYYEGLDNDFRLSNHSYRDYAKKVCKASLAMDKFFADMQSGVEGAEKKYKELKAIFDTLSQSAKFAEKSRSTNDVVGYGSFGELTKALEDDGFLTKPVRFSDDDIDLIIDEFRWIISAVGEKF